MKNQQGFSLCVAALVGLAAACGSNSDATSDGGLTGSSAGTLGTSGTVAGTIGAAGTTAGNGVGTGAGAGAGAAGTSGTVNSANCPATAPADNSACTVVSTQCTYGMQQCTCEMMGGAATAEWNCGFGGTTQICPATAPTTGAICTPGRGNCEYSATSECDCDNDTNTFICWNPEDCPATEPMNDDACPLVGMECNYDNGGGGPGGGRGGCDCTDTGWDCGGGGFNQDDAGI